MQKKGANISLKGYDDIFSTDQSRAEAQQERVQEIPLSELHPFEGHPFRVVDDEEMMKTAESVRDFGVLTPAIVRPDPDGGYEIVSGHRRHRASELAGKETFDAYLYQTLENKQKFISQIMTSKSPVRSCDDVDEQALSYAEIKALCAGNPLIKEKMDLDIDVARLKVLKADHQSQQYRMEDKLLKYFPAEIEKQTGYIHGFEADIKTVEAHPQIAEGFCGMEIRGKAYTEKADAGEILLAACKDTKSADPVPLGSYRGFQMELSFDSFRNEFDVTLKGAVSHRVALGTDARGNITRLDNALAGIPERLERANEQLNNLYNQQEAAKAEVGKPFPQEAELTAKSQRLAKLDAALNMEDSTENRGERSEPERPSVLADLKSKAEHIPPAKYSETREEVL